MRLDTHSNRSRVGVRRFAPRALARWVVALRRIRMPAGDRIPRILVESPESFCQHDRSCNTLPIPFPRAGGLWVGQRNGGGKGI